MTGHPCERRQLYGVALRQLLGLLAPGNGPDEPLVNGAGGLAHLGVRVVAYLGPEHQMVAVRAGQKRERLNAAFRLWRLWYCAVSERLAENVP